MSDYQESQAAQPVTPGTDTQRSASRWQTYAIGLVLSLILTSGAFVMASTTQMTPASIVAGLVALAILQMFVHLSYFLHITTAPAHKTNILALVLIFVIILLVVAGSLIIMSALNNHMMSIEELMSKQR